MTDRTFRVLATDYDGTLAHDGLVDSATIAALRAARDAGVRLVLVTGRELTSLANTFEEVHLFDRVVAENGAVVMNPQTERTRLLAEPASPRLIERLTAENVPISVGHTIVATVEPYERQVAAAISELGLACHIVLNKHAVMALPVGVTKATGLAVALREMGETELETCGIGDAENDLPFLDSCGLAVAVANALDSVKRIADVVTEAGHGAGVAEFVARLIAGKYEHVRR